MIVIVNNPQGCSQPLMRKALLDYFKAKRIVDDWTLADSRKVEDGDILLTYVGDTVLKTTSILPPVQIVFTDFKAIREALVAMGSSLDELDLVAHLTRQQKFSEATFGPGPRTSMVFDHIQKELKEVRDNPTDLEEWVDVILLAMDGAWRSGHTPQQIAGALVRKQDINESRSWPDWRLTDGKHAIEHNREEGKATMTPSWDGVMRDEDFVVTQAPIDRESGFAVPKLGVVVTHRPTGLTSGPYRAISHHRSRVLAFQAMDEKLRAFCETHGLVLNNELGINPSGQDIHAEPEEVSPMLGLVGIGCKHPANAQMENALYAIVAERYRQQEKEGWDTKHDDGHIHGELARAAACYALDSVNCGDQEEPTILPPWCVTSYWPWAGLWKPGSDPERDLVKAGALILAELERRYRAKNQPVKKGEA